MISNSRRRVHVILKTGALPWLCWIMGAVPLYAEVEVNWYTIDCGGATNASGIGIELVGTIGQPDATNTVTDGVYSLTGGFWVRPAVQTKLTTTIIGADPPLDNPFVAGQQPFRDVLQTGTTAALTQGIGADGTPDEDSVVYAPISVTFDAPPSPAPATSNITVACTGLPCPTVTSVVGAGAGPYTIGLSAPIPPGHCTTLTLAGTEGGQKVQYQSLPGDVNFTGLMNGTDVLQLFTAVQNGTFVLPNDLPRYDINRDGMVNNADVNRLTELGNGVNTTQVWGQFGPVAACAP